MFWPLLVRGLGMAFLFVPLSGLTLGGLNGKDVGQASGISNMIRQIGGSMSVAIIGVLNETLQAAILSYIDIFHYLTIFILISVPLVLFARTYKLNQDAMGGH